jgi:hypothetical protein
MCVKALAGTGGKPASSAATLIWATAGYKEERGVERSVGLTHLAPPVSAREKARATAKSPGLDSNRKDA